MMDSLSMVWALHSLRLPWKDLSRREMDRLFLVHNCHACPAQMTAPAIGMKMMVLQGECSEVYLVRAWWL